MGRYGRRISRSLIGVLIVTLVLGAVFYLKDLTKTKAEEPAPPPIRPAPVVRTPVPAATQAVVAAPTPAPPTTRPANTNVAEPTQSNPLAEATAKQAAGELLAARKLLNTALASGKLLPSEIDSAKKSIAEINQTVVFSPKRFADDEFGGTYSAQSGDVLKKIAEKYEVTWELLGRLNGLTDPKKLRAGQTLKVLKGPFNVIVSKSRFSLDVYLGPPGEKGSLYVTTLPVGLGKDDSTPTGTWLVEPQKKLKNPTYYSPRGEGVIEADDPKNPLGERWIGLTGIDGHAVGKSSYGIHGTIDESSIGKQQSMGCIRMKNADVEVLFDLLVEGKSIVVVKE